MSGSQRFVVDTGAHHQTGFLGMVRVIISINQAD
jgi:hypothetical protein